MTAKEKANSLVESFYYACCLHTKSKDCALTCVNEILDIVQYNEANVYAFWQEVKEEIELL